MSAKVHIVGARAVGARRLAGLVRALGHRARAFEVSSAFPDIDPAPVDLREARDEAPTIPRALGARSITRPTIALDAAGAGALAGPADGGTGKLVGQGPASALARRSRAAPGS